MESLDHALFWIFFHAWIFREIRARKTGGEEKLARDFILSGGNLMGRCKKM